MLKETTQKYTIPQCEWKKHTKVVHKVCYNKIDAIG